MGFEQHFKKLPEFHPTSEHHLVPGHFSTPQSVPSSLPSSNFNNSSESLVEFSRMIVDTENNTSAPPTSMTSNRQMLDKRRNLVVQLFETHGFYPPESVTITFQHQHKELFPSRWSLQVKIREVRQNIMKKSRYGFYERVKILPIHIYSILFIFSIFLLNLH